MAGAKNREYRRWPSRKSPANTYRCGDQPSARPTLQADVSRVARSTMSWPVSWTKQNRSPTPANQQRTTAVSGSESAVATATADGGCGLVSYSGDGRTSRQAGPSAMTVTGPMPSSNRNWELPGFRLAKTAAVPTVACPANGSSVRGVKIRTR